MGYYVIISHINNLKESRNNELKKIHKESR
jgi:hypothetical protein